MALANGASHPSISCFFLATPLFVFLLAFNNLSKVTIPVIKSDDDWLAAVEQYRGDMLHHLAVLCVLNGCS